MKSPAPLPAESLRRRCDFGAPAFRSTDELADFEGVLGQERAVEAIRFGLGMRRVGYNMFVLGAPGTGRHAIALGALKAMAAGEAPPRDWAYVFNFAAPHRPDALAFPAGRARAYRRDMARFVEALRAALPALFASEEYRARRRLIDDEFRERQENAFKQVQDEAQKRSLALVRTPSGLILAPVADGEAMQPDAFRRLPEAERQRFEKAIAELQERLQKVVQAAPDWESERLERVRELNHEVAAATVGRLIAPLREAWRELAAPSRHLERVQKDLIENVDEFLPREPQNPVEAAAQALSQPSGLRDPFRRYSVNVIVSSDPKGGAPVATEDLPTQRNLVGRVEHMQEMGALVADFMLIKPGALHRANGGYLLLNALKLLQQPFAWEALKRALRKQIVTIESPAQMASMISTASLEPDPIPLRCKVALVGDRELYYLLARADPEFNDLFKVAVDLDEEMERGSEDVKAYARLIATIARREKLRPLLREAVARTIEEASRLAADQDRLSVRMTRIADLLREADYFAGESGKAEIGAEEVDRAVAARGRRHGRVRDKTQEAILRDLHFIDTEGAKVGQINGLAVWDLGGVSFGRPTRITARVRMGPGEVVDIERRVELGGPLHSKGVLILSAFLGAQYAGEHPLSLSASLVFEQSYGGVDGDSASCAELYALLSALSGLPLRQDLAVTGSVNQHGQVQPIGGVNEKVEGFFDICRARGLSGGQGVLIPAANARNLMLRPDVVEAAAAGRFHVYPIRHVHEGIELLTGRPAGEPQAGGWPEGSVNRLAQDRLLAFAEARRRFGVPERLGEERKETAP
jgi:lon-related putative ATP-dependent protease